MKDIAWILFYLELNLLKGLPFPWVARWLRFSGRIRFRVQRRKRQEAVKKIRMVMQGDRKDSNDRQLAADLFVNYQIASRLSYLLMLHHVEDYHSILEVDGWERVEEALRQGKGAVLLASHVGIPRLVRWHLRSKDYRVYYLVLMGERPDAKTALGRWFKRRVRARFHIDSEDLFGTEDLSVQYLKKAHAHLRANGLVYITGDGRYGDRYLPVTVCGREVVVRMGGVALGLISGAPILPCFTVIEPGPRFRIQIQEPLHCSPGLSPSEQLRGLAVSYAAHLESYVRRYPLNAFRFFFDGEEAGGERANERASSGPSVACAAHGVPVSNPSRNPRL